MVVFLTGGDLTHSPRCETNSGDNEPVPRSQKFNPDFLADKFYVGELFPIVKIWILDLQTSILNLKDRFLVVKNRILEMKN